MPDTWTDLFWYCWNGLAWFFHSEERMAIQFKDWGWPYWKQLLILVPFNMLVIAWEIATFSGINWLLKFMKCFKIKTDKHEAPRFITRLARGRPIAALAILAFVPMCQKIGAYIFTTRRKYFGLRGYLALCLGGAARLAITIRLEKEGLWYMIGIMLLVGLFFQLDKNGKNHFRANGK